jgi:hypothetical protein
MCQRNLFILVHNTPILHLLLLYPLCNILPKAAPLLKNKKSMYFWLYLLMLYLSWRVVLF